ncbi:MAG: UxaA family hydrolase [Gemmataceae bacterium]
MARGVPARHQHRQLLGQHEQVHLEKIRHSGILKDYPNIDGVVAITHKAGCAMQYGGEDHNQLDRTLAGFAKHTNVAGYILLGLGCETGRAIHLIENQGLVQLNGSPGRLWSSPSRNRGHQQDGGSRPESGDELMPHANDVRRVAHRRSTSSSAPTAAGPTAIPASPPSALGVASNLLVAQGPRTSILAETPEIYGAEHLLARRSVTREVGKKLVERIKWWSGTPASSAQRSTTTLRPATRKVG